MPSNFNEFEKELREIDEFIEKMKLEARKETNPTALETGQAKIIDLEKTRDRYLEMMYDPENLGPWEKTLIARAPKRPYTLDYVTALCQDFTELQGDRNGFADNAIIGGPATFEGTPVMIIGHQKGRDIQSRQFRNFGMAKPEGYRKAIRLFEMAERFKMPVISFVDTPAADPGVESESRGISEAIAASIMKMFALTVPTVAVVIGEGGSGGAIGIAASSRVLMLEHSVYSVIPPEGCAAILWRKPEMGKQAAEALKISSRSALEYGIIDEILPEPVGGAHRKPIEVYATVKEGIGRHLDELQKMTPEQVKAERFSKFRAMGIFEEVPA
ncbi:MAG: acetyl-CoA carboxylase carboxyltransferase subunit alpha [Armatimonadota bacterium]